MDTMLIEVGKQLPATAVVVFLVMHFIKHINAIQERHERQLIEINEQTHLVNQGLSATINANTMSLGSVSELLRLVRHTANKVEQVYKLTDGAMGNQLLIAMVAAQALAEESPRPEYITLAKVAQEKYEAHMEMLKNAERGG